MKKRILAVVVLCAVIATGVFMARRYTVVVVRNLTGDDITQVEVWAEAFQLKVGTMRAGQSRWFVRRAAGSCALMLAGAAPAKKLDYAGGLILSDDRGYLVVLSIAQDYRLHTRTFPDAPFVSKIVASD